MARRWRDVREDGMKWVRRHDVGWDGWGEGVGEVGWDGMGLDEVG